MKMEIWKDIKNTNGRYKVSNLGRIKSSGFSVKRSNGRQYTSKEKILKPATDSCGYLRCALSYGGKLNTHKVHRLVADEFINGKTDARNQVNHKNGIKHDNRTQNLEWVSSSENCKHSFVYGLQKPKRGTLNGNSKLTEKDVKHIRHEHHANGVTFRKLSIGYKIDKKTISQICKFEIWKHIGK